MQTQHATQLSANEILALLREFTAETQNLLDHLIAIEHAAQARMIQVCAA